MRAWIGLLVLIAAILGAPIAAAAAGAPFLLVVDAGTHVLPPAPGVTIIPFWLNATCLGGPPPVGDAQISFIAPTWANVTIAPQVVTFAPGACTQMRPSQTGSITVSATRDAPAYSVAPVTLTATLDGPSGRDASSDIARVKASFAGSIDLSAPVTRGTWDPLGNAVFGATIDNRANGDVLVQWRGTWMPNDITLSGASDVALGTRTNASSLPTSHAFRLALHTPSPTTAADVVLVVRGLDAYSGRGDPLTLALKIDPTTSLAVPGAPLGVLLVALVVSVAIGSRRDAR